MKRFIGVMFVLFLLCNSAFAQGPGFPGDGDVEDVPLDGGASALVIGAAAYGARRLKKARQNKSTL